MHRTRAYLDAAAAEVLDALEAAGVTSLLLKGPALARLLYEPDEPRGYSDVDLLVAPGGLPAARAVLAGLGYNDASAARVFGTDDIAGVVHAELWTRRGNFGPLLIDLHWKLPGWRAESPVVWRELTARRSSLDIGGREAAVFGREALALHLATHAAQHGPTDVKALGDLSRGIERWPLASWEEAARFARAVDATPSFAAGLRLVPAGARLAQELDLPATDELTWSIFHASERPRGAFHLDALRNAIGVRQRADILRRSLLPTPRWIENRYPWAERGVWLLRGAYVAHLVSAPLWAGRAWWFSRRRHRSIRR